MNGYNDNQYATTTTGSTSTNKKGDTEMAYVMYTQQATKIGKNPKQQVMYAVSTRDYYECDNVNEMLGAFTNAFNKMESRDRLHIELRTEVTEQGDTVLSAVYVPNKYEDIKATAVLCRVTEE